MIREEVRLDPRRSPRYTPPRERRPAWDRRRPPRRRRGNGNARLLLAAGAVALTLGGVVAFERLTSADVDGALVGQSASNSLGGPRLSVPKQMAPSIPGFVNTLRGLADGAVRLTANDEPVELDAGGGFSVHIPQAWTEVRLVATDREGRRTEQVVAITDNPTPAEHPPTIAVHVRARDWADPAIHDRVIEMIEAGTITAVQLDIKGETGEVGYATRNRLARRAGTVTAYYDAREAIDELHGLGVRVIGRIVNFLDPILASWAWNNGRPEMLVLDGSGNEPLANNYGTAAFTNFANPQVRDYQIDLAVEAARLGFDEILYDYIRRPEGDPAELTFPGLEMPPDVSIARFVADTRAALDGTGVELGVSIFGISASRPEPTAQDVGLLAPLVDYISPMVYPALWNSGEYGVDDPLGQPAEIVSRSLADFERVMAGSGAACVPWLQAWNYGPPEVHAQIDAALTNGCVGYLLWNAASIYDPAMPKPL